MSSLKVPITNLLPEGMLSQHCEAMVRLCLKEFYTKRLCNSIHEITLELDENMEETTWGEADVTHEDSRPREFSISLNPHAFNRAIRERHLREDIVRVVAHEMIHIRQYASKELSSSVTLGSSGHLKMLTMWKGEVYKQSRRKNAYWFDPWEMEARAYEEPAFSVYFSSLDAETKKFFPV